MPRSDRGLILNAFLMVPGHHAAAWRHPASAPERTLDLDYYADIARTAERATIDSLFLADGLSAGRRSGARGGLEPLTLLSALAAVTERIGLIATASTTFTDPYTLARAFASLDHISGGRAGWNIVTSADTEAAANFGRDPVAHDARYRRAHEYLEVATGLWDSWEDDARVLDKASGTAVDGDKVHELNHVGAEFQVRGPLNTPRPPQGYPLLVQAGSSEDGKEFAARWAEAIFTAQQTIEDAQAFYADVKRRVVEAGRDPATVKVLPGLSPFIGSTEAEATALQEQLDDLAVPDNGAATQVWRQLGTVDLSQFPLDEPVPLHLLPDETDVQGNRSRFALIVSLARRERLTVRQLLRRLAGARGHFTFAGTPEQVADLIETWFTHGAADGFNIMPPLYPSQFEIFLEHVVPILQRRGLFHTEYAGRTLREHYGLPRPANQFARPRQLV
jgi:FMN-dependent oxidoreductase (nitrilotriacetate monooxygenase family)